MGIKDVRDYILGIPYYRFNPCKELYSEVLTKIPRNRQIWVNSSDVRFARNAIVTEFNKLLINNVLVFCDQDTVCSIDDIECLVAACTEDLPVIGSNMAYRGSGEPNWILTGQNGAEKRALLKEDSTKANSIIKVDYVGFGLVAIHRTALDRLINAYGFTDNSNSKSANLFSEYRFKKIDDSIAEISIKKELDLDDESWDKVKDAVLFYWNNRKPDIVLPESFSFCARCKEQNIPIYVHMGIRPGHKDEKTIYSEYPRCENKVVHENFISIIDGEVYN